ncbi:MAG: DEAD/DEAH box helicase [Candidatus Moranbacteria bacterium]|nr:DEAD/DEAH box helicase [Candidatus Moranbacteria bacterium]
MTDKKQLSEQDIRTKFITPAIKNAGWDEMTQLREEVYFTAGRIEVKGKIVKRGEAKKADYILYHKYNLPIAVIEAKDNKHSIASGIQQAQDYAELLDIPFAYSSNGDGFLEHDFFTGKQREISLEELPSPTELFDRYKKAKRIDQEIEKVINTPYYSDGSGKTPRYYQEVAINRTIEAVAKGQKRIMTVMATGTGKTLVAGQIIWRLWKSRKAKRILFLADRNILVDQTMVNDFKHFGDKMIKIQRGKISKAHEIYLGLYQSLTGNDEERNAYKEFSPDFFDLVIIDECHRGSASADSAWREVLSYFDSAVHIGLTATPKETTKVSNQEYFGEPIYTYSLKQGIDDGFLAPYKVIKIMLDKDVGGYRPSIMDRDREGREIEDKEYTEKDFDRTIVLTERTKTVAKEVSQYLKKTDRYAKTIIFCVDIDHAERMREALIYENSDLVKENRKYIMKITGDDKEGKAELDSFIDPENPYPTIVTTSKLMTTGVDAQTCKLIVLDSNINSMTEFKQIIGRGTRINEPYGKTHFTILDFRNVTKLFADPDFDGDPIQIKEIKQGEEMEVEEADISAEMVTEKEPPTEEKPDIIEGGEIEEGHREKIYVDDVPVNVAYKHTQYLDASGKLITESLKDYSRKQIRQKYASLDDFLQNWDKHKRKYYIFEELSNQGIMLSELQKDMGEEVGKDIDLFDIIMHVAFDKKKLMTRAERAKKVRKKNYLIKYSEKARKVLDALLDKYADEGLEFIEDINILRIDPFITFGSPVEIVKEFGGRDRYFQAVEELEQQIYAYN